MKKFMSFAIAMVGTLVAAGGTNACIFLFMDEPAMPKKLIEK